MKPSKKAATSSRCSDGPTLYRQTGNMRVRRCSYLGDTRGGW